MEAALLILAIIAATLFCPAMMWWQRRRGNDAACCLPRPADRRREHAEPRAGAASADELREQQRQLAARIAELEAGDRSAAR